MAASMLFSSCGGEGTKPAAESEAAKAPNVQTMTTPIIDRDIFFGNPDIAGGQLSPDGKYISFLKEYDGIMNVWVKEFDQPFESARPLTNSKRPMAGYFWTVDGKYILYVKDKDGDENMNIYAIDPSVVMPEGELPEARNLTPMKDVTVQINHVSTNNPDLLMISINDRDKAWHDLYSLEISTGKLVKLYENNDRVTGYGFDWDDNLRLLYKTDEKGNTVMMRKDGDDLVAIYETSVTEGAAAVNWNEDNSKFYMITNKGDLNLSTLYLMDPITTEMELIESDPEGKVDISGLVMDQNTRKMVYTSYTDDKTRRYWKDDTRKVIYEFLEGEFPGREVGLSSSTKDYSKFLVSVSGDKYASESWFYDVATKELIHQYTPRPKLKEIEDYLAPMTPITYKSSDGLEIPAYLTIPVGMEAKNLPVVIMVHGGPKGPRDYWGYHPYVQFLANRGYAVLQPNFRASGGFGKEFQNAGDLQWGKLMQDDITWGVKHLIAEGIADKNRVAIMGGSYGGYATLAGLAFTPDVYACGVDIVGPSNIATLLESVPAYWEAGRAFLYGMVGDPETEEGKKLIHDASPLFSADKITKPLLVVQGANDPRVKKAEADQIVVALRDNGHDVSYILADDEGHGFRKPVNNTAMFAAIEKFLAPILGGRYQEEMPEDIAKRLAEITIDVNTVVYSEKGEATYSEAVPAVANAFTVGSTNFDVSIALGDQSFPMPTVRTIENKDGQWTVSDVSSSQMGEMSDLTIYDESFRPVSRVMNEGGTITKATYAADKVSIDMGGKVSEVAVTGQLFDLSTGYENLLANMELVTGETYTFSAVDFNSLKAKTIEVQFEGTETVESVECKTISVVDYFDAADKIMIWVDAATFKIVKIEQVVPAMQNAIVTTIPAK